MLPKIGVRPTEKNLNIALNKDHSRLLKEQNQVGDSQAKYFSEGQEYAPRAPQMLFQNVVLVQHSCYVYSCIFSDMMIKILIFLQFPLTLFGFFWCNHQSFVISVSQNLRTIYFFCVKAFTHLGRKFTVKPTEQVKKFSEVNVMDYIRNLRTALNQTFKPMNITFLNQEKSEKTLFDFTSYWCALLCP